MVESIRFSGIASGLDTQSIVDSLMRAERIPLDRMKQKQQVLEWQRDDYREMNKLLKEFDQFIFDNIYKQSKMLARTATSSNSEFVTATAAADAGNVSYKIENVKLATAARVQSSGAISANSSDKIDPSKSLWSQRSKLSGIPWKKENVTNNFTVPEGGAKNFQLTKGAISELSSIEVTGGTTAGTYTVVTDSTPDPGEVYVDKETGKMVFGTKLDEGSTFNVSFNHNYLDFNIETKNEDGTTNTRESNFKISGTSTLNSMFNEINKSNVGVNIFYDSGTDSVVAQRKATGDLSSGNEINFIGDSAGFFTGSLKLDSETDGSDAEFTINGLATTRKSNTFTMNDVTFTLNKSSVVPNPDYDPVTNPTVPQEINTGDSTSINIDTNTDDIVKTIKDFVDKYNEMIGKINGELTEERFSTFTPLTDEQKAAMGEKEIEQWEEKAKSGMLRRDSLLTSGLGSLRTDLYSEVTSNAVTLTDKKYNQLAEIGITTTKDYLERGKLEIDEDELKAAIEDNPEAVYQLFMADGPTYQEKGLARRLRDSISDTMEKVEKKAGNTFTTEHNYSMGKDLLRMESDIETFMDRLEMREQRYWDQFNAMESAMQRLNSQSSQLLAQLGMGSQG